jgi:hypothetical protein
MLRSLKFLLRHAILMGLRRSATHSDRDRAWCRIWFYPAELAVSIIESEMGLHDIVMEDRNYVGWKFSVPNAQTFSQYLVQMQILVTFFKLERSKTKLLISSASSAAHRHVDGIQAGPRVKRSVLFLYCPKLSDYKIKL